MTYNRSGSVFKLKLTGEHSAEQLNKLCQANNVTFLHHKIIN